MGLLHYLWSRTAASNASADSAVNWAEGMAPSAVNDSGRAMMASAAGFRDDISGAIITTGTSTAYVVASYQVFSTLALMSGHMVAFTPHTTNGATVTLNVDALGAKPLRTSTGVELLAGMLIAGTPYVATYNNSDAVWYLHNFYGNPYNIPLGGAMVYFGTTAPNSSFVMPYGQAISRTTYSTLFTLFSTTFGSGDGSTTFNVPDLRGRVIAGKGDMGGGDAGLLTATYFGAAGTTLGATGGSQAHTLTTAQLAAHTHSNTLTDPGHTHTYGQAADANGGSAIQSARNGTSSTTASATTGVTITNASAGSGDPHNNVQPTIIGNYILRII